MSLAHVCPVCGQQLTRFRAALDPVYALPVVVCPCGFAAVRRRHPIIVHWRRVNALVRSLAALVVQLLGVTLFSLAVGGFVSVLQKDLSDKGLSPLTLVLTVVGARPSSRMFNNWLYDDGGVFFLITFVLVSVAAGMWLRGTLGHWRWPRPLAAWGAVVAFWVWFDLLTWPVAWFTGWASGSPVRSPERLLASSPHLATLLLVSVGFSYAGAPLGRGIARAIGWSRGRSFIKKLNRRRKARRGE